MRIIVSLVLATPCFAQSVLVVDDNGGIGVDHTSIQAAIDAAPGGAIISVRDGIYGSALIDGKSLVITTEAAGSVVVQGGLTLRNLTSSQVVTIRGIGIADSAGNQAPLIVEQNQGVVWLEGCLVLVDHADQEQGILVENSSQVVLRVCTVAISGGGDSEKPGIRASASSLHLYNVHASGSNNDFAAGSPGVELFDSFLYASESHFEGGDGGISCPTGCFPQAGGAGIRLAGPSGSTANLTNTVLRGGDGAGLSGIFAPDGPPAQIVTGILSQQTDTVRSTVISSPVRTNEIAQMSVQGAPGEFVFALYSDTPNSIYLANLFDSLVVGAPLSSFFLTTLDGSGAASVPMSASLPPGVLARSIYTQMLHYNPAAPAGSQIDLGTPTSIVILDESF